MEPESWLHVVENANEEVRTIIRAQRRLARIKRELEARDESPLEEDYIDADLAGDAIGSPRVRVIDGVQIVVRKLHRRGIGARDIVGADLMYEIEGQKYVTIQYKVPTASGQVLADSAQMSTLISTCPEWTCSPRGRWPRCGSWHAVLGKTSSFYHPACEANSYFAGAGSRSVDTFAGGLSKEMFDELFALCWIGAPIAPVDYAAYSFAALDSNRVLFTVRQRGRFA